MVPQNAPNQPLKKSLNEFNDTLQLEYRALLRDQDRAIASELSANLYSVYLHRLQTPKQSGKYSKWPVLDAPKDPNFYMDDPDSEDSYYDLDSYQREDHNVESLQDPITPLITAFDTYLKRKVYQRIHMDGLEPVLDIDPRAGQLGIDLAYKVLAILNDTPKGPISWRDLNIDDPRVIKRMEELYPAPESASQVHPRESSDLMRLVRAENSLKASIDRFRVPYTPKPYDYERRTTLRQELLDSDLADEPDPE